MSENPNAEAENKAPENKKIASVQTEPVAKDIPAKETFSREYVAELRAENDAWQKQHQKALAELDKVRQETQQHLTQTQQATCERIIRTELKVLALQAGLRDLDGLKLADLSTVTLEGAQEMLAKLKEAKPYLFTEAEKSTSSSEPPPAPKVTQPTHVSQLPSEEYERSKHAYLQAI